MTIYEDLTITDGDRFFDMLNGDDVFRNCDFDGLGIIVSDVLDNRGG